MSMQHSVRNALSMPSGTCSFFELSRIEGLRELPHSTRSCPAHTGPRLLGRWGQTSRCAPAQSRRLRGSGQEWESQRAGPPALYRCLLSQAGVCSVQHERCIPCRPPNVPAWPCSPVMFRCCSTHCSAWLKGAPHQTPQGCPQSCQRCCRGQRAGPRAAGRCHSCWPQSRPGLHGRKHRGGGGSAPVKGRKDTLRLLGEGSAGHARLRDRKTS